MNNILSKLFLSVLLTISILVITESGFNKIAYACWCYAYSTSTISLATCNPAVGCANTWMDFKRWTECFQIQDTGTSDCNVTGSLEPAYYRDSGPNAICKQPNGFSAYHCYSSIDTSGPRGGGNVAHFDPGNMGDLCYCE